VARRNIYKTLAAGAWAAGADALGRLAWQNLTPGEHTLALRGLSDLALSSDRVRAVIEVGYQGLTLVHRSA